MRLPAVTPCMPALFCIAALAGCTSNRTLPIDGNDGGTPDAGTTDAGGNDAGMDGGPGACETDGGSATCTANASYCTPEPANPSYSYDPAYGDYGYYADLNADAAPDDIAIELYSGLGVFANGIAPGTYDLTGAELGYDTCGLCIYIGTNIDTGSGSFVDTYFATGGTVQITEVTPTLKATLTNVTFTHVTIDGETLVTTPVGDGCDSQIVSMTVQQDLPPVVCTAAADYGTVAPIAATDTIDANDDGYIYKAALNADVAPDFIEIGLFNTLGVFMHGFAPGTYTIAGDELDYNSCGLCILIGTDADADGNATDFYFATGGTVEIDTFTPTLSGKLTNVTLTHIVFNGAGEMVIVGDCDTMIEELDFNSTAAYPACTAQTNYGAVTPDDPAASSDGSSIFYDAFVSAASDDLVDLELYAGLGAFAADGGTSDGGVTTGTFTLAGDELQYKTCGVCLLVYANEGSDLYLATGGTVTLTALAPTLTGTIANATFAHVLIDEGNTSTAVPDGCVSAIDSMPISAAVESSNRAVHASIAKAHDHGFHGLSQAVKRNRTHGGQTP